MFSYLTYLFTCYLFKFNFFRKFQEKQFLPTKKDIKDEEVERLANRLKGKNDFETLNNILEWEDRNIRYWHERAIMENLPPWLLFLIFFLIFGFVSVIPIIFVYFLLSKLIGVFLSIIILIILIFIFGIFLFRQLAVVKLFYIIIFSFPLYKILEAYLINFYNTNPVLVKSLLDLSIINWSIFGISLFMIFYMFSSYWSNFRGTSFLDQIKGVISMINNQFSTSLTVPNILKYRLAICRDYAKLTAVLLLNLYPEHKVYFMIIPSHVSALIEIDNNMYIIDQQMPILQLDAWLKRWNAKRAVLLEIKKDGDFLNTKFVKTINSNNNNKKLKKLKAILEDVINGLDKAINENKKVFEYPFECYSKLYNINDPIIKESVKRTINNKIKREFLSNFSKVGELSFNKRGKDLILKIDLNKEKRG